MIEEFNLRNHKYLLVHIDKRNGDEFIMNAYDFLFVHPQKIVNDSYNYMCLYDRKNTIVEMWVMRDEFDYDILAEMDYEKELKQREESDLDD